jgi:DNA repair photolyase
VRVDLSIGTLDEDVWRATEPGTPNPRRRVRAVEALNEAGIPSGVLIGPIIPGLSDGEEQLEEVVKAVVDAGAVSVGSVLLHLRPGVREHYLAQLGSQRPDLLERYRELYPEGRAYAPAAERKRVGGMVHRLVRRHGGPHAVRLTSDRDPEAERPVERPRRQRAEAAHQLGLDL